MPAEYNYDQSADAWNNSVDKTELLVDTVVRLRLIGMRQEGTGLYGVGTIRDDFLGIVKQQSV